MRYMKKRYRIMDIDEIELLIEEVEKRKPLYDPNSPAYRNRRVKKQLWQEICGTLSDRWLFFTPLEKVKYGVEIHKRWNALRDCFRRELNHQQNVRKGVAKRKAKYRFFDKLQFLLPHTQLSRNATLTGLTSVRTRSSFTRNTLSIDKPPSQVQCPVIQETTSTRCKSPSIPETLLARAKSPSIPETPPAGESPSLPENPSFVRETRSTRAKSSLISTAAVQVKSLSISEAPAAQVESQPVITSSGPFQPSSYDESLLKLHAAWIEVPPLRETPIHVITCPVSDISPTTESKSPSTRDKSPSLRDKSSLICDITSISPKSPCKAAKVSDVSDQTIAPEESTGQVKFPSSDTNSDEGPSRKKNKRITNYDEANDELSVVAKKGNRLTNAPCEGDSDELFLMSLKPFFKDLSDDENMSLRIGIMQSLLRFNMSRTGI